MYIKELLFPMVTFSATDGIDQYNLWPGNPLDSDLILFTSRFVDATGGVIGRIVVAVYNIQSGSTIRQWTNRDRRDNISTRKYFQYTDIPIESNQITTSHESVTLE